MGGSGVVAVKSAGSAALLPLPITTEVAVVNDR